MSNVEKYIRKYGKLQREITGMIPVNSDMIVVIPALAEAENLPALMHSLQIQDRELLERTLFLFVINNSEDSEEHILANNALAIQYLRGLINEQIPGLHIAYIDCSTEGKSFPKADAGVGLTRKTGMDIALQCFKEPVRDRFIMCLDADCTVEANYLREVYKAFIIDKAKTVVVRFEHRLPQGGLELDAIVAYELFLLHYQLGMRMADSYYQYHTVGSTMGCTAETYIKCEGMNMLKAGEDFYFLQKAAKVSTIHTIRNTIVHPSPRSSFRVPFGTGQRVGNYLKSGSPDYSVHNFESFEILKNWLKIFTENVNESSEQILDAAKDCSVILHQFLVARGFASAWNKIQKNGGDVTRQQVYWFDAFKSMMLLHHLRDNGLPDEQTFTGYNRMMQHFGVMQPVKTFTGLPDMEIRLGYLELAREMVWNG